MDNLNFLTNLKISVDIENVYRSLYNGDIPWYYPAALLVNVIIICILLITIIIELQNMKKAKTEKVKLFDIPQKKPVQSDVPKNKAQKLMEKIYLPKSKEQIWDLMIKVGANKVFIHGGKGATAGEVYTKDDNIDALNPIEEEVENTKQFITENAKSETRQEITPESNSSSKVVIYPQMHNPAPAVCKNCDLKFPHTTYYHEKNVEPKMVSTY